MDVKDRPLLALPLLPVDTVAEPLRPFEDDRNERLAAERSEVMHVTPGSDARSIDDLERDFVAALCLTDSH
jgi:hypothetical protein